MHSFCDSKYETARNVLQLPGFITGTPYMSTPRLCATGQSISASFEPTAPNLDDGIVDM